MALHAKHIEWLASRGIPEALASEYQIHTHTDGRGAWLRTPFLEDGVAINHKWRQTVTKRFQMDPEQPLLLWNHAALVEAAESGQPLLITEGEMDALAAIHCGHKLSCSVPNGAVREASENPWEAARYAWFQRHRDLLDKVTRFILATDGDASGLTLAADLVRLLGVERCWFLTYPEGCKDLNDVLMKHDAEAVAMTIDAAKCYPVRGLYRISDFPELPDFRPLSVGVPGLDALFPLVTGTFTVISGWAGHGKSSLLFVMLANLIRSGVPMALGSFETMPKPILLRSLRAAMYGCGERDHKAMHVGPADELIEKYLGIISNLGVNDETELTIEYILELATVAVLRHGIRLLVLDPWNEIDHKRGRDETETEYVGRSIRLLKRFAKDYDCAVWIVAHPRKPMSDGNPKAPSLYDLAGSANFANKADYGVIVHRDDLSTSVVDVKVVKKRKGYPGMVGWVQLDWEEEASRYHLLAP